VASNEKTPPASTPPEPPTFEQALLRLETLVHELEEGRIGLAEGLARYEEGIKLLRQCYELLENAERRIELLSKLGAAGEPITEPFDEAVQTLEEKSDQRSRRRSRKAPAAKAEPGAGQGIAGGMPPGDDDGEVAGSLF
jgi:exodeoxyribonuclease VII small subunit